MNFKIFDVIFDIFILINNFIVVNKDVREYLSYFFKKIFFNK